MHMTTISMHAELEVMKNGFVGLKKKQLIYLLDVIGIAIQSAEYWRVVTSDVLFDESS